MASNELNDTNLARLLATRPGASYQNECFRSTLLTLLIEKANEELLSQESLLPMARAIIAHGAHADSSIRCFDNPLSSIRGLAPLHLIFQSRGYEPVAMCSLLIEAGADVWSAASVLPAGEAS